MYLKVGDKVLFKSSKQVCVVKSIDETGLVTAETLGVPKVMKTAEASAFEKVDD